MTLEQRKRRAEQLMRLGPVRLVRRLVEAEELLELAREELRRRGGPPA